MKFPGKCLECGKPIPKGQPGLWSRGVGVKHEDCSADPDASSGGVSGSTAAIAGTAVHTDNNNNNNNNKILCALCGRSAGCLECELADNCDIPNVSQICLCSTCSQKKGVMEAYYKSVSSKYPVLSESKII